MGIAWGLFDGKDSPKFLHRGKGVPLKGPFLAHFSQGNFGKVNENVHFGDFRIFAFFKTLLRLPLEPFHLVTKRPFGHPSRILEGDEPQEKRRNINKGIQRETPHPSMNHFHKSDRRLEGEKD